MSTLSIAPAFVSTSPVRRRAGSPARRGGGGTVRLTRRGRAVLSALFLLLLLVAFVVFSGGSMAAGESGTVQPTRTVVVSDGDTLWGIASGIAEPGRIREVVYEIKKLNSLPDAALVEGQVLALPVG